MMSKQGDPDGQSKHNTTASANVGILSDQTLNDALLEDPSHLSKWLPNYISLQCFQAPGQKPQESRPVPWVVDGSERCYCKHTLQIFVKPPLENLCMPSVTLSGRVDHCGTDSLQKFIICVSENDLLPVDTVAFPPPHLGGTAVTASPEAIFARCCPM